MEPKYIAIAMEWRDITYCQESRSFVKTTPFLVNPCGSDGTYFIHGIKTIKGAIKRVRKIIWDKRFVEIRIVSHHNWKTETNTEKLRVLVTVIL